MLENSAKVKVEPIRRKRVMNEMVRLANTIEALSLEWRADTLGIVSCIVVSLYTNGAGSSYKWIPENVEQEDTHKFCLASVPIAFCPTR